ncbi:MAG TPA: hypothetical protein VL359_05235 [bacterium]|nr:hypothetical protein [bacterium]
MAETSVPLSAAQAEKVERFLIAHRRIVADFARSLENARHFLNLAERALEREPGNTLTLLSQIREIDLLGHLSRQFEEFQAVAGALPPQGNAEAPAQARRVETTRSRYEDLIREAESQLAVMDRLQAALSHPH